MNLMTAPFVSGLVWLYLWLGNLGWAVVFMTMLIRLLLMPLVWPSLASAKKMQELGPRLKRLKDKYGKDKEALAKAQMDLYKNEGINPLSGCLPQLLQVAVLIMFFSAFGIVSEAAVDGKGVEKLNNNLIGIGKLESNFSFNSQFLGSDLVKTPAMVFGGEGGGGGSWLPLVLLAGSAIMQFLGAKMMAPAAKSDVVVVKGTEDKEDDIAVAMRNQSTYMMPIMTVILGWNFSLGVLLYWFVNSAVMLGQQAAGRSVVK